MEKLFNCEIANNGDIYNNLENLSGIKNDRSQIKIATREKTQNYYYSDEEAEEKNANCISYTELYRKFKEKKNCLNTHNRLPVNPYKFPQKNGIKEFEKLKNELIKDKKNKRKKNLEKTKKKVGNEEEEENNNKVYHTADLKIYTSTDFFANKQKKTLRERIYNGEVMFYEDYIEKKTAEDYETFFNKPYEVKRQDEGGKYYFFGKKLEMTAEEDIYRKYNNLDDEYFINKFKTTDTEQKKKLINNKREKNETFKKVDKEYENLSIRDKSYLIKLKNEYSNQNMSVYEFYKKNKNIIFNKNLSELKKKELLNGNVPDIVLPINITKVKHPQNCTVSFHRLQEYALALESLNICPYLYNVMDAELMKNWKVSCNENLKKIRPERPKKGYKKDIYVVNKEKLEHSKNKLKGLQVNDNNKEDEITSLKNITNLEFKKKEREKKVISGGRYVI